MKTTKSLTAQQNESPRVAVEGAAAWYKLHRVASADDSFFWIRDFLSQWRGTVNILDFLSTKMIIQNSSTPP